MKILLAVDGSENSQFAIEQVIRRPWPSGSVVRLILVCRPFPYSPFVDPGLSEEAVKFDENMRERGSKDADCAARLIRDKAPGLKVEVEVLQGSPEKMIIEEAERWGADLIMVGSHGYSQIHRFLLGSVAQSVVLHAPCSVEVVRKRNGT